MMRLMRGRKVVSMDKLPQIIIIYGPNAAGKSSLGIKLAQKFNGEIISADSRQIYRGFDLCCGKISEEESKIVPHHMLNIKDVGERFSAYEYQKMVYILISEVLERGKVPFLVGGTWEYIAAVADGYLWEEKPYDEELRRKLEKLSVGELQLMLTPEVREEACKNRSDYNNKRRLINIIEMPDQRKYLERRKNPDCQKKSIYDALWLGVTWPEEILHQRIEKRLETRIEQGMIHEIEEYIDHGGKKEVLNDLGLEYKYILQYLSGGYKSLGDFKSELEAKIKKFAKKQMMWLRKRESIYNLCMTDDYFGQACSLIYDFLKKS